MEFLEPGRVLPVGNSPRTANALEPQRFTLQTKKSKRKGKSGKRRRRPVLLQEPQAAAMSDSDGRSEVSAALTVRSPEQKKKAAEKRRRKYLAKMKTKYNSHHEMSYAYRKSRRQLRRGRLYQRYKYNVRSHKRSRRSAQRSTLRRNLSLCPEGFVADSENMSKCIGDYPVVGVKLQLFDSYVIHSLYFFFG